MTRIVLYAMAGISMLVVSYPVIAQSDDLFYGTRKLDPSKSKYSPGPAPNGGSLAVTMKPEKDGFLMIADTVSATGEKHHNEVFATFDGKEHPMGDNGNMTIAFLKIDDNTYARIDKVNGQVVSVDKITVSDGGRTHTMEQIGKNRKGEPVKNILVFTK